MIDENSVKKWKDRINKLGLKQGHFAESLGIRPQTMSCYVTGRMWPSVPIFIRVENKLKQLEASGE